ncbi:translation initiation factor IF-2 [Gracilaria domingensis]|nr:translation initiation factor IF-2 [Gracilaria domingensis]
MPAYDHAARTQRAGGAHAAAAGLERVLLGGALCAVLRARSHLLRNPRRDALSHRRARINAPCHAVHGAVKQLAAIARRPQADGRAPSGARGGRVSRGRRGGLLGGAPPRRLRRSRSRVWRAPAGAPRPGAPARRARDTLVRG